MPKIRYSCNCPDYARKKEGKILSRGIASSLDSDWSDKEGSVDVAAGEMCKHIFAAKIQMGELKIEDIPKDIPLEFLNKELS